MRILIALLAVAAFGAEDKPTPKPPEITAAAKVAYWRTRALASEAKAVQAQAEQALASACGAEATPLLDQAGELSCTPKPKSAPESK